MLGVKIMGRGKISSLMLPTPRFLLHLRGKILLRTPSVINAGYKPLDEDCPQYLAVLLKNKKLSQGASGSGIFTIEPYTFPNKSWVYDTNCGTHICNTTQGLRGSRKLKPGALSLYVGNGQRAAVEAIGSYHLSLPSGLVIVLNNCHYAPSITLGIILVSYLYDDGYVNQFMDNLIQVSRNNMVYFSAVPRDGIFEIDLTDSYTNVSSIYALSNKRSKSNLDYALLWHCCLGHISKKRIEKLQHDVLFNSTYLRAFEKCVPCMSANIARKPYTHQVKRAKDLLGLIHTDVCGPFKIMPRQGASYFVTFTDDFSRYGYVYMLRHKHEVFETFKVFQKEVENQLCKTIKSLRSDREGEYMSQNFLDHLKDHGIIAHRTPPYTPQHNGVSKRRNKILLDMVRSMMSQTTLPNSFWDYALKTVTRILNMVQLRRGKISSLMLPTPRFLLHLRGKILLRTPSVINAGYKPLDEDCPQYLAVLLKNKKLSQGASGSGIFTIEPYTFPNKSWVYDTNCGTHICNTTQGLRGSRKLKPGALSLYVGNGQRAAVEAIGSYHLSLPSGLVIVLNNCHYAPSITLGIILVSRLYDDGYVNQFMDNLIQVSRNNMVYFSAVPRDGIFEIDLTDSYTNVSSIYALSNKRSKSNLDYALLWHCCLGHISKKRIEKLQHDVLFNSTYLRAFEKCVPCMSANIARKPYTHQVKRAKDLLGLIHTDVCGPFKIMPRQGASYFVTFTDDFSRYGYVYMLRHKHEVFETFKVFQKEVENQLCKTIKSLRSDREGEYMSQNFLDHLKDHGIIAHRTPPYTPQHNGVSKRRNKILLDMVEKTPCEVWHGQAPKLSYLKVWGCEALVKRDTLTKPDKLEPMSIKCIFIGYLKEMMGYSFYYPPENKVLVAQNAEFLENSLITQEASGSLEDLEIIQKEDTHPSIDTSLNHEEDDLEIDEPQRDLGEPADYKAALLDPEPDKWLNAMNVEMQSMKDNEVWDLVELPPNDKSVDRKWLFKKKTGMDGAVHTYKARLVAKGYTQTPGINYEETFSPVADIRAIRILIAIAVFYEYEIWKIDVKTAFLNGYLFEEVYMEQPEGDLHWTSVKNILKYFKNTKDMFLVYEGDVDWKSAKQSIFGTSYAEAEYIPAFDAFKEAV
nr:hypothetical protein [Tanacetum cinerariifolium]